MSDVGASGAVVAAVVAPKNEKTLFPLTHV